MAKHVSNLKVKVDRQEEFIVAEVCLFQLTKGDKFLPGLLALTGQQILIFNDYAPSEKVGDLNVYHPVFTFDFDNIKKIELTNLYGNSELKNYAEMLIIEKNSDNQAVVYFDKKKAKHFKKVRKTIVKVGKIKIKTKECDCSEYN